MQAVAPKLPKSDFFNGLLAVIGAIAYVSRRHHSPISFWGPLLWGSLPMFFPLVATTIRPEHCDPLYLMRELGQSRDYIILLESTD